MKRAFMLVLIVFFGCNRRDSDSVPWMCELERIQPEEPCTAANYMHYVCAACDPVKCSNCPVSWVCIGTDDNRRWQEDAAPCDCIDSNGWRVISDECWGDSE